MWSSLWLRRVFLASLLAVTASTLPLRPAHAEPQKIRSVEVQEQPGITRVVLRGATDPTYTTFLRENPARLVVEIADITLEGVGAPIEVGNPLVQQVSFGAFSDPRVSQSMARISIALAQKADYEVKPDGEELVIEIRSAEVAQHSDEPKATEAKTAPAEAATKTESEAPAAMSESASSEPAAVAPKPKPAAARARLLAVNAEGDAVSVRTSKPIEVKSFDLSGPPRVVVDLIGAAPGKVAKQLDVPEGAVERVRVGAHPDKVRVVVDLREAVSGHRVEKTADGIKILLGGDAMAQHEAPPESTSSEPATGESAAPGAESTPAAPESTPYDGPARVLSAHFESLPDVDRIVITMQGRVEAATAEPDPNTLMVRLPGVSIDKSVERRVDTREFGGPVQIFSIFQAPDVADGEVRVVLKRRAAVKGNLNWVGDQLHVELPRGPGDVARTPGESAPLEPGATAPATESAETTPAAPGDAPAQIRSVPRPGVDPESLDDPFQFDGPADPASIDTLQEGGFSEEKEYVGRRISLDFKDADIGNILRLIAEVSDLNVIAGEEVQGTVTIRLVDVPWDQALDVILLTKGLGFVRVGNVLRIAPLETIKLESEQRLQERRAKEKLEDLVVKLQPVNYADVDDVAKLVKRLLTKRGSADVDQRTSTLIIKDIPSVVQEATALVKAIDTQTPQVLIEAKIVEANLSFSRSLGTVWGIGYDPVGSDTSTGGNDDFRFGNTGRLPEISIPGADNPLSNNNFITSTPAVGGLTGLLSLGLLSLDDHLQLDLQIQAAEDNQKGKVISSPRVVTIDNKEAVIKQGVAIAFTEATVDRITTSFIDAVLELKVTPHITADRSIIMKIKVTRNAPQLSASSGSVTGIAKNETQTEALVRDGETIVLGGIYVVDTGRQTQKVPFLADIPLIGGAFRARSVADERRELLIFVTPRVILGRPTDV